MKEQNRNKFKKCAKLIDVIREIFGEGVKVRYVQEGNSSKGNAVTHVFKRLDDNMPVMIGVIK